MSLRAAMNLADAFAEVAARQPERAAVTLGERTVSYAELEAMATRAAVAFEARGVRRGDLVALVCDRTVELVALMLGVLRAGAAYLPIDPRYPTARVSETLADAQPRVVVSDGTAAVQGAVEVALIFADEDVNASTSWPERSREDLAYVIYTSGSTGKPKGVMVTQGNVLRLFSETDCWYSFGTSDVWTMFHSPSFDFSVWEIWGALLYGGRLVLVPFETCRDPEAVCGLIEREGVTVLNQSPAAFHLLMQAEARRPEAVRSLRYVIFGGEALNLRALLPWFARHGDARPQMVNMYGITETTVHVTYRRVMQADAERESDSLIGVAIADLELYVLDGTMQPADEGELWVGGAGVARGYLHLPELTAQRFVPNPFGAGRLYRSGDLVRRRADGELVYLGRGDRQVKLRGYRIELGEVEAVLLQAAGVRQVVADVAGDVLTAYVVGEADARALRVFAAERLPEHMRPGRFVSIETVPLTINGKIDRAALQAMAAREDAGGAKASMSAMEARIAAVWQRVLGLSAAPAVDVNFFEAGGTSLLLHALRTQLEDELARPISILMLFQHSSIGALATSLEATGAPGKSSPKAATRPAFRPIRMTGKQAQR